MTKLSIHSFFVLLLCFHFTPSLGQTSTGLSNVTFFDEHAHFSTFELFKNNKLFYPCPNSTQAASNTLVPRRGGGRGGGGGGGGTIVPSLITAKALQNEGDFCKALSGNVVIVPTIPSQTAFFPWWPTFIAHGLSLAISYFGLWRTSRVLERCQAQDMKLPIAFWVQLPFDIARLGAWFFMAIYGLINLTRFGWVSVILWLIPFNYIWLIQLLRRRQEYHRATSFPMDTRNEGWKSNIPLVHEHEVTQYPSQPYYQQQYQPVAPYPGPQQPVESKLGLRQSSPKIFIASILLGLITGIMWILTLIIIVKHWLRTWGPGPSEQTYSESPKAVTDPTLLGALPTTCIDWLKGGGPITSSLLDPTDDEYILVSLTTFQFIICSTMLYKTIKPLIPSLNKKKTQRASPSRILKFSILATITALLIPVLFTGIWTIVTTIAMKKEMTVRYTNDLKQTGGCTFVMVVMDKKWGYWDVSYELPLRIVMSLLGAA